MSFEGLDKIDFVALVTSEFFEMDVRCEQKHLFKYLHFPDQAFRSRFLARPTIKFATKAQLNDPFDLSRRFDQLAGEAFRNFARKYLTKRLERDLSNVSLLVDRMAADERFMRMGLSKMQLRQVLESPLGQSYVAQARENMQQAMPTMLELAFHAADGQLDEMLAGPMETAGIYSMCEINDNRALWSVYAGGGAGICLQLDAQHEFFLARQKTGALRNRLMKVSYRDDRSPDLFSNPYYLFGVKHSEYAFEREWRLLRSIEDCDAIKLASGDTIYTMPAPAGLIKGVIFGHRWLPKDIHSDAQRLLDFDSGLLIQQAVPNATTGGYSIVPVV